MLIQGNRKLLVAQPVVDIMSASNLDVVTGWRQPDGTWLEDGGTDGDGPWGKTCNAFLNRTAFQPCLFDLYADVSEKIDTAADEVALVQAMWASLNATVATSYVSSSATPTSPFDGSTAHSDPHPISQVSRSPAELLGPHRWLCLF